MRVRIAVLWRHWLLLSRSNERSNPFHRKGEGLLRLERLGEGIGSGIRWPRLVFAWVHDPSGKDKASSMIFRRIDTHLSCIGVAFCNASHHGVMREETQLVGLPPGDILGA
jgi:hypothetical protein